MDRSISRPERPRPRPNAKHRPKPIKRESFGAVNSSKLIQRPKPKTHRKYESQKYSSQTVEKINNGPISPISPVSPVSPDSKTEEIDIDDKEMQIQLNRIKQKQNKRQSDTASELSEMKQFILEMKMSQSNDSGLNKSSVNKEPLSLNMIGIKDAHSLLYHRHHVNELQTRNKSKIEHNRTQSSLDNVTSKSPKSLKNYNHLRSFSSMIANQSPQIVLNENENKKNKYQPQFNADDLANLAEVAHELESSSSENEDDDIKNMK